MLRSGGQIVVVTIDPLANGVVDLTREARSPRLGEYGAGAHFGHLVRSSVQALEDARQAAGVAEGTVRVYPHGRELKYAGYCFGRDLLIFVPREHLFDSSRRPPRLEVGLARAPEFADFWEHEMQALTTGKAAGSHQGQPLTASEYLARWPREA